MLERAHVVRRRADRSIAHHRPGRERRLPMAGDQVRTLQDAKRCRPRGDEAPADHLCARSRQPLALPPMRQSGPASIRDSATISLAASPPSNRNLTDLQSLFDYDKSGGHHRAVSRREYPTLIRRGDTTGLVVTGRHKISEPHGGRRSKNMQPRLGIFARMRQCWMAREEKGKKEANKKSS
jgi:hypothetical protein